MKERQSWLNPNLPNRWTNRLELHSVCVIPSLIRSLNTGKQSMPSQ